MKSSLNRRSNGIHNYLMCIGSNIGLGENSGSDEPRVLDIIDDEKCSSVTSNLLNITILIVLSVRRNGKASSLYIMSLHISHVANIFHRENSLFDT